MSLLRNKAKELSKGIKRTVNLAFMQSYDSIDSVLYMDEDNREELRSVSELIGNLQEDLEEDAEAKDEMSDKLVELQKDIIKINSKLDTLMNKIERREMTKD